MLGVNLLGRRCFVSLPGKEVSRGLCFQMLLQSKVFSLKKATRTLFQYSKTRKIALRWCSERSFSVLFYGNKGVSILSFWLVLALLKAVTPSESVDFFPILSV